MKVARIEFKSVAFEPWKDEEKGVKKREINKRGRKWSVHYYCLVDPNVYHDDPMFPKIMTNSF